jgi:hypothetical protein
VLGVVPLVEWALGLREEEVVLVGCWDQGTEVERVEVGMERVRTSTSEAEGGAFLIEWCFCLEREDEERKERPSVRRLRMKGRRSGWVESVSEGALRLDVAGLGGRSGCAGISESCSGARRISVDS